MAVSKPFQGFRSVEATATGPNAVWKQLSVNNMQPQWQATNVDAWPKTGAEFNSLTPAHKAALGAAQKKLGWHYKWQQFLQSEAMQSVQWHQCGKSVARV